MDNTMLSLKTINFLVPQPQCNRKGRKEIVFTKLDAFRDLMARAQNAQPGHYAFRGERVTLYGNDFIAMVTELAAAWGWGRTKTREFLEDLESLGHISTDFYSKFYVIAMCPKSVEVEPVYDNVGNAKGSASDCESCLLAKIFTEVNS